MRGSGRGRGFWDRQRWRGSTEGGLDGGRGQRTKGGLATSQRQEEKQREEKGGQGRQWREEKGRNSAERQIRLLVVLVKRGRETPSRSIGRFGGGDGLHESSSRCGKNRSR